MTVDVGDALLVGAQRERFAHHLVEVHHHARALALAREGQQVADDARGAFGFAADDLEAAARLVVGRMLGEALGPGENRRERVVQFVRDARNRLAERGHLFRLQKLVVQIARLIVHPLALGHVADERDKRAGVCRIVRRGDFDPGHRPVDRGSAQQIIGDVAVSLEFGRRMPLRSSGSEKRSSREWANSPSGVIRRVAEDGLEMGIDALCVARSIVPM